MKPMCWQARVQRISQVCFCIVKRYGDCAKLGAILTNFPCAPNLAATAWIIHSRLYGL